MFETKIALSLIKEDQSRFTINEAIELLAMMLKYGNSTVQKSVLQQMKDNPEFSQNLFRYLRKILINSPYKINKLLKRRKNDNLDKVRSLEE